VIGELSLTSPDVLHPLEDDPQTPGVGYADARRTTTPVRAFCAQGSSRYIPPGTTLRTRSS
jgi:hypothetical protein